MVALPVLSIVLDRIEVLGNVTYSIRFHSPMFRFYLIQFD